MTSGIDVTTLLSLSRIKQIYIYIYKYIYIYITIIIIFYHKRESRFSKIDSF